MKGKVKESVSGIEFPDRGGNSSWDPGAKPLEDYDNLSASAYLRAKEDYLMGINFRDC